MPKVSASHCKHAGDGFRFGFVGNIFTRVALIAMIGLLFSKINIRLCVCLWILFGYPLEAIAVLVLPLSHVRICVLH